MRLIADLHLHSPYSRATSKEISPLSLSLWSALKGINIVGTGDILHPKWLGELKESLVYKDELFSLEGSLTAQLYAGHGIEEPPLQRFLLTGEISCIYKQEGRVRKVHHLLLFPDFEGVESFRKRLEFIGNLESDGRPIVGLDSYTLLSLLLESSPDAVLIPAHVWTPWFSLFGSHSGFDSVEECFKDLSPHIFALETGLSSDPPMNRLISKLDRYQLVSNSDAHSLHKLGREATLFEIEPTFKGLVGALITGQGLLGTVEFFPEEGKYHYDGHRACKLRWGPDETLRRGGICPRCGRPVTKGVLHRVRELADRTEPKLPLPYVNLIPLEEILAEIYETSPGSKLVQENYLKLISSLGPEIPLLMEASLDEIERVGTRLLRLAIQRMREGKVRLEVGFDGQYGRVYLFEREELRDLKEKKGPFFLRASFPREEKEEKKEDRLETRKSVTLPAMGPSPNPEQKEAIEAPSALHLLIQAGPGTGKTFTLVMRILYLLKNGADPSQMLCLTFTRRAKAELEKRLKTYTECLPEIRTFHSLALSVLRESAGLFGLSPNFTLVDPQDAQRLRERSKIEGHEGLLTFSKLSENSPHLKELMDKAIISPLLVVSEFVEELSLYILRNGDERTKARFLRYKHIFVDEFQDTSPVELQILAQVLTLSGASLWAIGDQNQAIYGFRGISNKNIEDFSKIVQRYKTIVLRLNYRSSDVIVNAANRVIEGSGLVPLRNGGKKILIRSFNSPQSEGAWIALQIKRILGGMHMEEMGQGLESSNIGLSDIGILYRLNEFGVTIEGELKRMGIPCLRISSRKFVELYPVKVVYSELRERFISYSSPHFKGSEPVESIIQKILDEKGIREDENGILSHLLNMARESGKDFLSFWEALLYEDYNILKEGLGEKVILMSVHASKGLEWDVVFLVGLDDGIFPLSLYGTQDLLEERRLFYVGITRAKKELYITTCSQREIRGKRRVLSPSPFLSLLPPDVVVYSEESKKKRMVKRPLFSGTAR